MFSVFSKNRLIAKVTILLCTILLSIQTNLYATEASALFVEGRDYVTKFPFEKPKKPVVVEFFSFMCPACFQYEATILRWKKQKPDSVEFIKIPVAFGRADWKLTAKAFYIAEELKVADKFSRLMFKKVHVEKATPRRLADIEKIFLSMGISKSDFSKAAKSFTVDSKLRKAEFLSRKYKVPSVPYFLVNYKYVASDEVKKTQESLFRLWNRLPERDF